MAGHVLTAPAVHRSLVARARPQLPPLGRAVRAADGRVAGGQPARGVGVDIEGSRLMDTYLTVHGNLVADPVQRSTAAGATVVGFRLASSGRRFDKPSGEFRDGDTMYISVSCWRSLAAHVLASLRKGDGVLVLGRLLSRSYDDKQGNRRSVHEIDAIAVGPDLARCPADLRRPGRSDALAEVPPQQAAGAGEPGREADARPDVRPEAA